MAQATESRTINGVPVDTLFSTLDLLKGQPELAKFTFRAQNRWINGAHNRTTITSFFGANQEIDHAQEHQIDAGEPEILVGTDTGANPAEAALHALAACLTTTLVYSAAARGVTLTEVESTLEGNCDVQGALGLNDDVHNGFDDIKVSFKVKGDAPREQIESIVANAPKRSFVFDTLTRAIPVTVELVD
jgi:uncharacterized OsmC-like protein